MVNRVESSEIISASSDQVDGCPGSPDLARRARLWHVLRPTFNHDLPNLLVALQGLLQMLKQDHEEQLGPSGREYLQRLLALSQKLQVTAGGLKAINKVCLDLPPAEAVALAEQLREVAATAKKMLPKHHLILHTSLKLASVHVPRLFLHQALVEMIRLLAGRSREGTECHCFVISRPGQEEDELLVGELKAGSSHHTSKEVLAGFLAAAPARDVSSVPELDYNLFGTENRLGVILIEETVAAWGGRVANFTFPDEASVFLVTMPKHPRPTPAASGSTGRTG